MRTTIMAILLMTLMSCSNPLDLLTGGTQVNTNAQVGQQNNQTIGQSQAIKNGTNKVVRPQARVEQTQSQENRVKADRVETVVVNETPMWLVIVAIIGWFTPTPDRVALSIYKGLERIVSLFKRKGN